MVSKKRKKVALLNLELARAKWTELPNWKRTRNNINIYYKKKKQKGGEK